MQSAEQEVKYDMQIFADRIEFCWIHLRGITALENSLWAYDGHGIRIWLNALAIERQPTDEVMEDVKESVTIPLSFYPLCKSPSFCFPKLWVSCAAKISNSRVNGQGHHHRRRERASNEVEPHFCHVQALYWCKEIPLFCQLS